jgi:hypothetical protein
MDPNAWRRRTRFFLFCGLAFWPTASVAGDFEIIRSTLDRVWRLDKRTGEISVCRLDQIEPVCVPAREGPGASAIVKDRRVVHVVRQSVRPVVVIRPAHGARARKWK